MGEETPIAEQIAQRAVQSDSPEASWRIVAVSGDCLMATSLFARRVWWSLVFFVCLSVFLLAAYVGFFGETLQAFLHAQLLPLRATYRAHKGAVDLAALVVGLVVPGVTGGLAILKGFYYAEINLPRRLQELADTQREQHLHQRPAILAYVRTPFKTADFLTPAVLANPFSMLLGLFGWISPRNQARVFATRVDQFADEIRTLDTKRADIENRKVTGHLLRAAYFEVLASNDESKSLDWKKHVESALNEYKAIIALRPDTISALEGAATQSRHLNDEPGELQYLNTIIVVAGQQKKALPHARALRQLAEVINLRSSPVEWNSARGLLVTGRRLVEHKAGAGTHEASELAETLLLYGDVQTKREKFTAARKALNRAGTLFAGMSAPVADAGKMRVDQAIDRLNETSGDKEAAGA